MSKPRTDTADAGRSAREVATRVLERVAQQGAYASLALDAEISRARLDRRDAALATHIVYGALRVLPVLDREIAGRVKRDPATMDGLARAALRAGAYQLYYLDRVPAYAVVDGAVGLLRAKRGKRLAGFANAVLRKLAQGPQQPLPSEGLCLPDWLLTRLRQALGAERAASLLASGEQAPEVCLRVTGGVDRGLLAERIKRQGVAGLEVRPGALSPRALHVSRGGDPRSLPGYAQGAFCVQEEGAQCLAWALAARQGERIADLCAGHGGKTLWLAEAVGETGYVDAVDVDETKLDRLLPEMRRLGLAHDRVGRHAIDLSVGVGALRDDYDRVLVDAPCTGLGTVHRRPELLLRIGPQDPSRMAELQVRVLSQAARLVRNGGLLGLSVCSPLREEGAEVAERFEADKPEFFRVKPELPKGAPEPDPDGILRIGPWSVTAPSPRPDAYQLVMWRRRVKHDSGGAA